MCVKIRVHVCVSACDVQSSLGAYKLTCCDVDLDVHEQRKRKLQIWEVSIGLLVKERGETK